MISYCKKEKKKHWKHTLIHHHDEPLHQKINSVCPYPTGNYTNQSSATNLLCGCILINTSREANKCAKWSTERASERSALRLPAGWECCREVRSSWLLNLALLFAPDASSASSHLRLNCSPLSSSASILELRCAASSPSLSSESLPAPINVITISRGKPSKIKTKL